MLQVFLCKNSPLRAQTYLPSLANPPGLKGAGWGEGDPLSKKVARQN